MVLYLLQLQLLNFVFQPMYVCRHLYAPPWFVRLISRALSPKRLFEKYYTAVGIPYTMYTSLRLHVYCILCKEEKYTYTQIQTRADTRPD